MRDEKVRLGAADRRGRVETSAKQFQLKRYLILRGVLTERATLPILAGVNAAMNQAVSD
jgi:hypothetical protein